jgi:hypothetical protein
MWIFKDIGSDNLDCSHVPQDRDFVNPGSIKDAEFLDKVEQSLTSQE